MIFRYTTTVFFSLWAIAFAYTQGSDVTSLNNEGIGWEKLKLSYTVEEITLSEDSIVYNAERHFPALRVNVPEADRASIYQAWIKAIKGKSKSRVVDENDIISMLSTVIPQVSHAPISIYSILVEKETGSDVIAAFESDGEFLSPAVRPDQYENARQFLRNFAATQYKKGVATQIVLAERLYKKRKAGFKKLQKENQRLHTKVKESEIEVVNTKNDVEQSQTIQKTLLEQLIIKKKSMSGLSGELLKQKKKEYRDLEREKERTQHNVKMMSKKIIAYKAKIEESKQQIMVNLSEQDIQKERLQKQLIRFKSLEAKRNILAEE